MDAVLYVLVGKPGGEGEGITETVLDFSPIDKEKESMLGKLLGYTYALLVYGFR